MPMTRLSTSKHNKLTQKARKSGLFYFFLLLSSHPNRTQTMQHFTSLQKQGTMKIVLFCLFSATLCYAQQHHLFSVYYGLTDSALLRKQELVGAASDDNLDSKEFGAKYSRVLTPRFTLDTGVNFFRTTVQITPAPMGITVAPRKEQLRLISIPLSVTYSLGKVLYCSAGPIFDFQQGTGSFDSQSGVGYSLGLGGKYQFDSYFLFVQPNFKRHSTLPFARERYHQKLTQFGVEIGLGWVF